MESDDSAPVFVVSLERLLDDMNGWIDLARRAFKRLAGFNKCDLARCENRRHKGLRVFPLLVAWYAIVFVSYSYSISICFYLPFFGSKFGVFA